MDTFIFALNAVLPIILLISFGYLLKRVNFITDDFLKTGNKIVFKIALPALLFFNIYSVSGLHDINWSVMLYAAIGIFILLILGIIVAKVFIKEPKQKGVIVQTIVRANFAIIGIPLAESIGGTSAVSNVALIALVSIPLMSALSVFALSLSDQSEKQDNPFKIAMLKVIKNPLIIGVSAGLFVLWIRTFIPVNEATGQLSFSLAVDFKFLFTPIKWLSQITTPLALIVLGATFKFGHFNGLKKQIIVGTIARSIVGPIITLGLVIVLAKNITFFKYDENVYPALISLFASPTAITNAVMAKEMNGDERLSVQLVVWTTIVSILTIFVTIVLFRFMNLI
ncbi:MAG: AEC family transporter [Candidatus Izemoplasmatales bacterium]|nr:AEC family transporter [Candidatus Izemoplasmatales bacterium]